MVAGIVLKRHQLIAGAVRQGKRTERSAIYRESRDQSRASKASPKLPGLPSLARGRGLRGFNPPGNWVGPGAGPNLPGNGFNLPGGGGIPGLRALHLKGLGRHHAMTGGSRAGSGRGSLGSGHVAPVRLKSKPLFAPVKPLAPPMKPPKLIGSKQPKPMTSVPLPPLPHQPVGRKP